MCRPSQTPHLTMSSTRIGPRRTLTPEVGRWSPVPLHWISKETIKVVVFHWRRSSHLFYPDMSLHNVKLESSSTVSIGAEVVFAKSPLSVLSPEIFLLNAPMRAQFWIFDCHLGRFSSASTSFATSSFQETVSNLIAHLSHSHLTAGSNP